MKFNKPTNKNERKDEVVDINSSEATAIQYCDSLILDAILKGASDIHIEPFSKLVSIRYRIDGKLKIIDELSLVRYPSILARFKIMAEMNIAERRIPQEFCLQI